MLSNRKHQLLEKIAYIVAKTLNEARVLRTIDPKIWATVASGISKKYKSDMGATCKARLSDTKEVLLQKYVAALLILKLPCPVSLEQSKAFPLWAKQLVVLGATLSDVTALYDQNSGKVVNKAAASNAVQLSNDIFTKLSDTSKIKARVLQDESNSFKVVVNYRTLLPSGDGGGHEDKLVEEQLIPMSEVGSERIIEVIKNVLEKYDTTAAKMKCRDGWYTRYYHIDIFDPLYNIKTEIEITRERKNPGIWSYINGGSAKYGMPTYEMLYKNAGVSNTNVNKKISNDMDDEDNLPKFKITYDDGDDISSVWTHARDKQDAIARVKREYHDIKNILMVSLIKS